MYYSESEENYGRKRRLDQSAYPGRDKMVIWRKNEQIMPQCDLANVFIKTDFSTLAGYETLALVTL